MNTEKAVRAKRGMVSMMALDSGLTRYTVIVLWASSLPFYVMTTTPYTPLIRIWTGEAENNQTMIKYLK